jgi:hypothetical protein
MTPRAAVVLIGSLLAVPSCTRTIYVPVSSPQPATAPVPESRPPAPQPEPPRERPAPAPATASTLGIPAGHLPDPGECRVWIPGTPPGRQRSARSSTCNGIAQTAPGGSWVVYRPSRDRRLVHVRVTDRQRPGHIVVVHVFEAESGRFLRDEAYDNRPEQPTATTTAATPRERQPGEPLADPRRVPQERPAPAPAAAPTYTPGTDRTIPVPPPTTNPDPAPTTFEPGGERRKPTPATTSPTTSVPAPAPVLVPVPLPAAAPNPPRPNTPAPNTPTPNAPTPSEPTPNTPAPNTAPLDIPPGHFPTPGQCRIWIPGTPPGQQPNRESAECDRVTRDAPAGSWVVYRPIAGKKVIHVRVVDARRPGVIVVIRVYDQSGKFVREEQP